MGQPAPRPDFRRQLLWLFFLLDGRISRAAFVLAVLGMAVVQAFALYQFSLAPDESGRQDWWAMVFLGLGLASLWSTFALAVKRLHDFGKPGILAVTMFVPIVLLIAFLLLCVVPGDSSPNRYGPRSNGRADGS